MTTVQPLAGRREWVGLGVVTLACLLYVMDLTVLHVAIPQISEDLHPSGTQLLWIIDGYGFTVAGTLVTMGTLGDRIGRAASTRSAARPRPRRSRRARSST
jgi:MFS transporter, DHA2 family, multidrug resistance protein